MQHNEIERLVKANLGANIEVPQSAIKSLVCLAEIGKSVVESAINWLDPYLNLSVNSQLKIIGRIVEPVLESLISLSKDRKPDVQRLAAALLGAICDAQAIEPLIELAKNKSPTTKRSRLLRK